jgi:hypothetical protein
MITFFLTKQNAEGSMSSDKEGENKQYNEGYLIPAFDLIPDKRSYRVDSETKKRIPTEGNKPVGGKTHVACVSGENTIYVDEQRDPLLIQKYIRGEVKIPKLQFTEGRRLVDENDTIELEYLRATRFNEANKRDNKTRTFFEFKPQEISTREVTKELDDIKIKSRVLGLPQDELFAVASVSKSVQNTKVLEDIDSTLVQHSVLVKLKTPKGKELIESLLEDKLLVTRYDIQCAIDKGILRWHPHNDFELQWSSGGVVCKIPAGTEDRIHFAANYLTYKGHDTIRTIRTALGRILPESNEIVEEESVGNVLVELSKKSPSEVIDAMFKHHNENKEQKFFTQGGAYFFYGDGENKIKLATEENPKGKDGLKDKLLKDKALFQILYEDFVKRLK